MSQVPVDNIPDGIVNNEAYMLFYQRRKIDNMECSGTSSTSGDHWVSKIAVAPNIGETASSSVAPADKSLVVNKNKIEIECEKAVPDEMVSSVGFF